MREVKALGWSISLTDVGIDEQIIVRSRVQLGGHNVPRTDILRRYELSLANLSKAAKIIDKLILYDNSTDAGHQLLATIEGNSKVIYVSELPSWVVKANLHL